MRVPERKNRKGRSKLRMKKLALLEEEEDTVIKQRGRNPYDMPVSQPRRWQPRLQDIDENTVYVVGPSGEKTSS